MNIQVLKIGEIKPNPKNPRVIKNDKFRKLVQSIKEFPKMLEIRPIVINKQNIILGGNMRFRASQEAGLTEIPTITVNLTEEEENEFIVKDNSSFGEWDWDMLSNFFELDELGDWGLDIPVYLTDDDVEPQYDKTPMQDKLQTFLESGINFIRLHYASDDYEKIMEKLDKVVEKEEVNSYSDLFQKYINNYTL